MICNIQFPSLFTIVIILIYRPPSSSLRSFLTDLSSIIASITSVNTVIIGNFNIQINNDNYASLSLNELIFEYSLTQHIRFPTNTNGNTIDLVLTLADSNLISYPTQSSLISDHFAILFDLNLPVSQINRPSRSFRKISSIDKPMFVNSVFHQLNNSIYSDLSTLFDSFNLALSHSLDIFAPSIILINRTYSKSPWFNTELIKLRQLLRRLQRKYSSSKLDYDLIAFKACRSLYKNKLLSTKSSYFTDMLGSYEISSKQAYKLSFTLVGKTQTKHLPGKPDSVLCSLLANFFQQKISSIINVLPNINSVRLNPNLTSNLNHWSCFTLPTHDFVLSLMTSLKTNSPLDPIPLNLLRSLSPSFIGLITEIIH